METNITSTGIKGGWALILGASSGFGEAAGLALAQFGMNIFGVHLDRRATMPNVERIIGQIEATGRQAVFFNTNAADAARRQETLDQMQSALEMSGQREGVRVLLHSLAFGTLKPFIAPTPTEAIRELDMNMTLDVMANSLVYWVQDLLARKMLGPGGKIFAMTSAGGHRVWPSYGAVSAAKAALESHIRQLALELAPLQISANSIRAGVTDTPALRRIPGNEVMINRVLELNPGGRLTTTQDVAETLVALCQARPWMTGNIIGVDGGEDLVG
ncbi:MAG: SDR family oxidoreductase [Acidobacteria bacterium]|nr:SDR family oxidoreductase [Acidobacteriota bacterium]MBI3656133.1 SDR family oxidoreductase [Acidobacteriota bacterium]